MNNLIIYNGYTYSWGGLLLVYNILIVSEDQSPFAKLDEHLKKDFFNVYHKRCDELERCNDEIRQFDFILLHLTHKEDQNKERIQSIKRYAVCPVYVFSKGHKEDEIASYMSIGSEGHVEIPFSCRSSCSTY